MKVSKESWWNYTDRVKKYSEKTPYQCPFINHKSHMDWARIEPGPSRWQSGDYPP